MFDLETKLGEGSKALATNSNINSNAETWVTDEQISLWVFFARVQSNGRQQPFFGPLGLNQKRRVDS
jgi:hypothetical protein